MKRANKRSVAYKTIRAIASRVIARDLGYSYADDCADVVASKMMQLPLGIGEGEFIRRMGEFVMAQRISKMDDIRADVKRAIAELNR